MEDRLVVAEGEGEGFEEGWSWRLGLADKLLYMEGRNNRFFSMA